jgi:hypothetical protein
VTTSYEHKGACDAGGRLEAASVALSTIAYPHVASDASDGVAALELMIMLFS